MLQEAIEKGVDLETARWQARVDLAAAHRVCVMHGFNEGIFNHLTYRVPGTNDRYFQIPFGLYWSEVTASCFMEVSYDGERLSGEGDIERSCYCIHAPIHRLAEHAGAVFHTHMPFASALTRLKDQRILPEMGARVSFAIAAGENRPAPKGVAVSREAVKDNGRTGNVLVIRDDETLEAREVTLGAKSQSSIVLMSGVSAGERLVTGDTSALKPGMRVKVEE